MPTTHCTGSGLLLNTTAAPDVDLLSPVLFPVRGSSALDINIVSTQAGSLQRQVFTGVTPTAAEFKYADDTAALADAGWQDMGAAIAVVANTPQTVTTSLFTGLPQRFKYNPSAANHTTKLVVFSR